MQKQKELHRQKTSKQGARLWLRLGNLTSLIEGTVILTYFDLYIYDFDPLKWQSTSDFHIFLSIFTWENIHIVFPMGSMGGVFAGELGE